MIGSVLTTFAMLTLGIGLAAAQAPQPYLGMQQRATKSLSDQQVEDLKGGRGMGLALAAEFNGYPGPMHLLELADQLALSPAQRAGIREWFEAMKAEAVAAAAIVTPEQLQRYAELRGHAGGGHADRHRLHR